MIVQVVHGSAGDRCGQRGAGRIARIRAIRLLLAVQQQICVLRFRQHVVDRYDAVRSRASGIVHNRDVRLHPDPSSGFRQKPVVLGYYLPLVQYCEHKRRRMKRVKANAMFQKNRFIFIYRSISNLTIFRNSNLFAGKGKGLSSS